MRDGGRLAAAIEILEDLEKRRRPAQDALKDWGLGHRFAGSKDRNAIGNLVFDVLRRQSSLSAIMGSDTVRARVLAAYALTWNRGLAGLDSVLDPDDRHAPPALSPDERRALEAPALPEDAPDHVRANLPEWLIGSFRRALDDRLVAEGEALAARADVDLRVNTMKADRAAVLSALGPLDASPTPWSPIGVRVPVGEADAKAPHVVSEFAFKRGEFEVQDEGSQLASLIAAEGGATNVVDLCAGGGGKSLALAARLGPSVRIHAYDNDKRRFGDILDRIARAGTQTIEIVEPRGPDPLAPLDGTADLVVVDAPCTGTGTWRRRPDAKWRLAPGALATRLMQQDEVLDRAARLTRPGGRICYITCSLLPEENEDRLDAFLKRHPAFAVEDTAACWQPVTGKPLPPHVGLAVGNGTGLRLSPYLTSTDGFFVCLLRHRG